jgi:hypothetical protein
MNLCEILLKQNYFIYSDSLYLQKEGLWVGSPSPAFISEVCPNHEGIYNFLWILTEYQIFGYLKYEVVILLSVIKYLALIVCLNSVATLACYT